MGWSQTEGPLQNVVITSKKKKTKVRINKKGELTVNVSPKNLRKFKAFGLVRYSDFGAKGNGKTDDIDAIAATHAFANENSLMVKADEGYTYYLGRTETTGSHGSTKSFCQPRAGDDEPHPL